MFNGKIHYKWPFSIAMLNYQRVDDVYSSYDKMQHWASKISSAPAPNKIFRLLNRTISVRQVCQGGLWKMTGWQPPYKHHIHTFTRKKHQMSPKKNTKTNKKSGKQQMNLEKKHGKHHLEHLWNVSPTSKNCRRPRTRWPPGAAPRSVRRSPKGHRLPPGDGVATWGWNMMEPFYDYTWWLIPVSKWVITPVIMDKYG